MKTTRTKTVNEPDSAAGGILRRWLSDKMVVNPSYSLRSMARSLGISPGFLSQVMRGRKKLSSSRAVQFSQIMKLDDNQTTELLRAVTIGSVPKGSEARTILENVIPSNTPSLEYKTIEVERFKVLSHWYHLAILDLSETEKFKLDPNWISRRLKISPIQAATAIERLKNFGLLVKKNGDWKKSDSHIAFAATQSNAAIREHHHQMISKSLEALSDVSPGAFNKRSVTGIVLSINPEKLPEAFEMIDQFRRKMERQLSRGKITEVYQLNVQLFNLSHSI